MNTTTTAISARTRAWTSIPAQVRPVRTHPDWHHRGELAWLNLGFLLVCGLAVAYAAVPVIEQVINLAVAACVVVGCAAVVVRVVARWVRERAEDRADLAYAATVRATVRGAAHAGRGPADPAQPARTARTARTADAVGPGIVGAGVVEDGPGRSGRGCGR